MEKIFKIAITHEDFLVKKKKKTHKEKKGRKKGEVTFTNHL